MTAAASRVFHRNPKQRYPTATGGAGAYLVDDQGRRYLDASGGAAVSCLGHGDPEIIAAIKDQLDRIAFAHTAFFTNPPMEALADDLITHAPAGLSHSYFVSGGSEAVEAAIKLARQYFVEIGQPQRRTVIARHQSYHGNTLGALAVGGNQWRRRQFEPLLIDVAHVSACYGYRGKETGESDEAYGARLAVELETTIARLGGDRVIAFVAETVVGATAGVLPPVPGYFRRVRELCDRSGILLILDEVMCGMGRTGTLHACEQEGIAPDLMAIAKGLGAGYQPIGAVLINQRIVDAVVGGSGFFQHGHTYMGHPAACAAALAVQRAIRNRGLLERVRQLGDGLAQRLHQNFAQHPHIGDIRGRGLFWGLELVRDRETKAPFDPALKLNARIKAQAMAGGLMCYPMGGTIDGVNGDHVLLAPPFILEDAQLDELAEKLSGAIGRALAEIGA
ncbi:MAG: aspartate aminotransferase family protein [Azospirillum sp.]|nr:aspartate aminotransferase family protein [Azospirillum sp.]